MKPQHLPRNPDMEPRYQKGDLVRIVPKWRDPCGGPDLYFVYEDNGDRLTIQPVKWEHGPIVPRELVAYYMVEGVCESQSTG